MFSCFILYFYLLSLFKSEEADLRVTAELDDSRWRSDELDRLVREKVSLYLCLLLIHTVHGVFGVRAAV